MTAKLKQAETRSEFAEKSVQKLQKEVSFVIYIIYKYDQENTKTRGSSQVLLVLA